MILYDYGNSVIRGVDMAEYINRDLHELLIRMAGWFPVVSLTGPRQSGKSTLVRHAFPDYSYVTLEDPKRGARPGGSGEFYPQPKGRTHHR